MLPSFVGFEIVIIITSPWWYKKDNAINEMFSSPNLLHGAGPIEGFKTVRSVWKREGPEKVISYRNYGKSTCL